MGTTPGGLPYPEGTDRVMDGDDAIRALAEKLGATAAGQATVVLNNAPSGSVAVTFPAGRFTSPPVVNATAYGTTTYIANNGGATVNGVNIGCRYYGGTATTANVVLSWQAVQTP